MKGDGKNKVLHSKREILRGIKVADFGWAIASPLAATYLGYLGATVVTVESRTKVDLIRQTGPFKDRIPEPDRCALFAIYNAGKYSISLNLKIPQGVAIAKELIKWADVLVENFAPGVTRRLGIDYESARLLNPSIIYASSTQLGQTGPHAQFRGMGVQGAAMAGFFSVTGWSDGEPVGPFGPYTDLVGPRFFIPAILAALLNRHQTGKGQYIAQSQVEAGLNFMAPALLDYSVNGVVAKCVGNREANAAPHGAYRCLGDDRWCVIAIYTDDEWKSFCKEIGKLPWIKSEKFSTLLARKRNEGELDALVEEWTSTRDAEEVVSRLQKLGIPSGLVAKAEDLCHDAQLLHRGHYHLLEHPVIGFHRYESPGFRLSRTPAAPDRSAPCLGQHNEYICTAILGMTQIEYSNLEKAGAFE